MVVNADGLGLPGIEMWSGFGAVVAPPAEKGPEASAARRTVTGGDGGFTLGVDAKRHESPGTLLQAADPSGTYAPATALARGDAPVRFVLQPAARFVVQVVDTETLEPVPGALVSVSLTRGSAGEDVMAYIRPVERHPTDPDGRHATGPLLPGAYAVTATHESYGAGRADVEVAAGVAGQVTVELPRGVTVEGRLLDTDGEPVVNGLVADVTNQRAGSARFLGAEALLQTQVQGLDLGADSTPEVLAAARLQIETAGQRIAFSGPEGRYRLDRVAPGARNLVAVRSDLPPATRTVDVDDRDLDSVDLRFPRGAIVEGYVRDESGAPISGASVRIASVMGIGRHAETDEDGFYRFGALPAGGYMVFRDQPGEDAVPGMPQGLRTVQVELGKTVTVDFGTQMGVTLSGRVLGAEGLDGAARQQGVFAVIQGKGVAGMTQGRIAVDGTYELQNLEAGQVYEIAVPPAFRRTVAIPEGQTHVVIDLMLPDRTLAGRVLTAEGDAVVGARVEAGRSRDQDDPFFRYFVVEATTGEDGGFVLEGLGRVDYHVRVNADAGRAEAVVSLKSGAAAPLTVVLEAGGVLAARFIDLAGQPAAGLAVVMAEHAGTGRIFTMDARSFGAAPELRGLPAGTYHVSGVAGQYAFDQVTIEFDGIRSEVELALSPGGSLQVTALDGAGQPLEGVTYELRVVGGAKVPTQIFLMTGLLLSTSSDGEGRLTHPRLKAGRYDGTLTSGDGTTREIQFEIRDGETTPVTVRFDGS
jgi:hypothetical protein